MSRQARKILYFDNNNSRRDAKKQQAIDALLVAKSLFEFVLIVCFIESIFLLHTLLYTKHNIRQLLRALYSTLIELQLNFA